METTRVRITNEQPKPWSVEFYKTTPEDAELIHEIECDSQDEAFAVAARNQARHGDLIQVREYRDIYLEEYVLDPGVFHWRRENDIVHDEWAEVFA